MHSGFNFRVQRGACGPAGARSRRERWHLSRLEARGGAGVCRGPRTAISGAEAQAGEEMAGTEWLERCVQAWAWLRLSGVHRCVHMCACVCMRLDGGSHLATLLSLRNKLYFESSFQFITKFSEG